MKKSNSYLGKILLGIFVFLILFPILTMIVWVFTERWAWPNLLPQVFSTRALDEVFGRKEELIQLFASSIFISAVVGVLSVMIGTMTARALVLYDFAGKGFFYFLSMLPFLVPSTVFAMGIQVSFIRWGLSNTVTGVVVAHTICSLPYAVHLLIEGGSWK